MPISRLLQEMTSEEFDFWQRRGAREFLGDDRDDYRTARLEAAIANFAGKTLKDDVTVTPLQCMPYLKRDTQKPKRWTRKQVAMQANLVFGAFRTNPLPAPTPPPAPPPIAKVKHGTSRRSRRKIPG